MNFAAASLAAALVLASFVPAVARPVVDVKYTYYAVSGGSAKDLEYSMFKRGPRVGGAHGYASTRLTSSGWRANFQDAKGCRVRNFELDMDFTIRLPKLSGGGGLQSGVKSRFASFVSFAKRHEETHKTIWLSCAREAERQVLGLRTKSCGALKSAINSAIAKKFKACEARHYAFDSAQRGPLARHPFIKQVIADSVEKKTKTKASTNSKTAALKTKKRKRA